jgi:hypothetical protein
MKKLTFSSKLTLSKETLRKLNEERLQQAQGGGQPTVRRPPTGDSAHICCV